MMNHQFHTRRAFLKRSGQLALSGTALPLALNLAAMGEAAAFDATDYKALVCVFLYGGNDYANTVVTYDDPSYNLYSSIRGGGAGQTAGGIALAKADLAATLLTPTTAPIDVTGATRQYALHPAMSGLTRLFNAGHAAVQLNVGPLVLPLTRAQYSGTNRTLYPLPPQLFSHNDQQSIWQSSSPEGSTVGWGGNIGDLALSGNSNATFTCMSVTGNAVFLSGDAALQYQVSTSGAIRITPATAATVYGSSAVSAAMSSLIQQTRSHKLENEYNRVTRRAISAETTVTAALGLSCFALNYVNPAAGASNATTLLGFVLTLCAAAMWAMSSIVARRVQHISQNYSPVAFVVWSSTVAVLPFVALSFVFDPEPARWHWLQARASSWLAAAYLGWGATVIGYGLWTSLLKRHPANRVAPFGLGVPIVGLAAGMLVLGEVITAWQWAGIALLVAALACVMLGGLLKPSGVKA